MSLLRGTAYWHAYLLLFYSSSLSFLFVPPWIHPIQRHTDDKDEVDVDVDGDADTHYMLIQPTEEEEEGEAKEKEVQTKEEEAK